MQAEKMIKDGLTTEPYKKMELFYFKPPTCQLRILILSWKIEVLDTFLLEEILTFKYLKGCHKVKEKTGFLLLPRARSEAINLFQEDSIWIMQRVT